MTPSESSLIKRVALEPLFLNHLRNKLGIQGVKRVSMHEPLTNLRKVLVRDRRPQDAADRSLARALRRGGAACARGGKYVIAVNEDIDPDNADALLWAMSYRANPALDLQILQHRDQGHGPRSKRNGGEDASVLIDATLKEDFPPISLPKREFMENAKKIWEELGLPKLKPQSPWFGYSLGEWSEEFDRAAELAVKSDYFKTGELIAKRRRKDVKMNTEVRTLTGSAEEALDSRRSAHGARGTAAEGVQCAPCVPVERLDQKSTGNTRRTKMRIARLFALMLAASLFATTLLAQSYPSKPIRLLVPFGPGGVGDITSRAVMQKMSEAMGQQIIIDNRPSAGGIVATETVAKSEPDGYTLYLMNNTNAVSAAMFKKLPYDTLKDFEMVSTIGGFSIVVLVAPDSPVKTLKELIAQAKAQRRQIQHRLDQHRHHPIPVGRTAEIDGGARCDDRAVQQHRRRVDRAARRQRAGRDGIHAAGVGTNPRQHAARHRRLVDGAFADAAQRAHAQ